LSLYPSALFVLLLSFAAVGAELSFSADVDRTLLGLGEQLRLTVTVQGTNIGSVPRPSLPELPDFTNLGSTSSQSTNISLVGGRMTQEQTVSFIYTLAPRQEGELTIGPCRLDFKGTTYQTQPITITVTKESQAPPRASPGPADPFGWDPFGSRREPAGRVRDEIHLAAYADRTNVFQGEQVNVTFTLYTRRQLADVKLADVPTFNGFWVENLFDAKEVKYSNREYQGRTYSAAPLKRVALFPTRSGSLLVSEMKLAGQAVSSGGFFFQSAEPFEVSSSRITIEVKPLPETGKPESFCGGVGRFDVSAGLSSDSSVSGQPVNLTVAVSGSGNLRLIGPPRVPAVPGLRVLNPETKDKISESSGKLSGSRSFVYPVMPQSDGRHVIPALELGFFDPATGAYYARTTPRLELTARGALPGPETAETSPGMKVLGSDVRHIKPEPGRAASSADWLIFSYPAGVVLLAAGLVLSRHRRRLERDSGYARKSRSGRLVRKRLAEARRLLEQDKPREFYAALSRAVLGYAGDRFNIETHGFTGEELERELVARGADPDTVARLLALIKSCDEGRFSPGLVACSKREVLEGARKVLEEL